MTLQELVDYYDKHAELQEEIPADVWEWWNKVNIIRSYISKEAITPLYKIVRYGDEEAE